MRPVLCVCCVCLLAISRLALAQTDTGAADRAVSVPSGPIEQAPRTGFLQLMEISLPGEQPLTQKQRFVHYLMRTVGPFPIVVEGAVAGFDQGLDRPHEWRQGAAGYGKRFASAMAYNGVRQTLGYGMATLLHEDTRYFPSESQGAGRRTAHALLSTFTARHNGREVFSVSAMTGVVGASLISRAWAPPSWQHGRNVATSIGFSLAGMAGFNVLREFLPGLLRRK